MGCTVKKRLKMAQVFLKLVKHTITQINFKDAFVKTKLKSKPNWFPHHLCP